MKVIRTVSELRNLLADLRMAGHSIGFVPTMGALHEGHISLLTRSREQCSRTVVSIFVNPTQFNSREDLEKYPRNEEKDLEMLRENHCDIAFVPSVEEMYPPDHQPTRIDLHGIDKVMEGRFRPGHFAGVVEIVSRLFSIVLPDMAFFGKKDFQQVAVIREMVRQLELVTEIVACETLRESNGLARSSRNLRLSDEERQQAGWIFRTLDFARKNSQQMTPDELRAAAIEYFKPSGLELEYLEIVNPGTLRALHGEWVPQAVMCIAAFCGTVRLIDNTELC